MYTDCYYDYIEIDYHHNDIDFDVSDIYSSEELEEMRKQAEEERYNAPISMDSLGLSWRDFF